MRHSRLTALFLLLMLSLVGCAGTNNLGSSTEFRLRSLEAKFLELEEKQRDLEQRAFARIAQLEGKMSAQDLQASFHQTLPPSEPARSEPDKPLPREEQQPAQPAKRAAPPPAKAAAPRPKPAPPTQVAKPKPPVAPPSVSTTTGQPLYDEALQLVQQGKTAQARELLQRFVRENTTNALLPNAVYWIGETWYHEKEYGQAILAFKDVAGRFPTHDKAPAAMLKIGYCYEQLEDRNNARFYLQALVDEYPDSEPARTARKKLQNLGG